MGNTPTSPKRDGFTNSSSKAACDHDDEITTASKSEVPSSASDLDTTQVNQRFLDFDHSLNATDLGKELITCGGRFFLPIPSRKRQITFMEYNDEKKEEINDDEHPHFQTSESSCFSGDSSDSSLETSSPRERAPKACSVVPLAQGKVDKRDVSCTWFLPSGKDFPYQTQFGSLDNEDEYYHDDENDDYPDEDGMTKNITERNKLSSSCSSLLSFLASNQNRNLLLAMEDDTVSDPLSSSSSIMRSQLENLLSGFSTNSNDTLAEEGRRRRSHSWLSFSSFGGNGENPFDQERCSDFSIGSNPIPSSIIDDSKELWIVTTAALPWFTGTAVNPLLRAAYFLRRRLLNSLNAAKSNGTFEEFGDVHLVVPWLELENDRRTLYGPDWLDKTQEYQRAYILDWLKTEFVEDNETMSRADNNQHRNIADVINIHFYTARYHTELGSIFPMGDVCNKLPVKDSCNAVCVLEEPEHLNYFLAPASKSWRDKFAHVVGVIHTNYPYYVAHKSSNSSCYTSVAKSNGYFKNEASNNSLLATSIEMFSAWMVQAYCDKVIKLSSALPMYASTKETVSAVHGIRNEFLKVGRIASLSDDGLSFSNDLDCPKVYFLGKLLWAKGLDKLLELQYQYRVQTGNYFPIDIYGSGSDQSEIQAAFAEGDCNTIPTSFKGRIDHALIGTQYSIFVNPSESEVLCTTTAEAIAMRKFAIIPEHPSNMFFVQFPNCLTYKTADDFIHKLQYALTNSPQPLSSEHQQLLTWEAATERFIEASYISEQCAYNRQRSGINQQEQRLAAIHRLLGSGRTGDLLRKVCGGGPCASQYEYEKLKTLNLRRTNSTTQKELNIASSGQITAPAVGESKHDDAHLALTAAAH